MHAFLPVPFEAMQGDVAMLRDAVGRAQAARSDPAATLLLVIGDADRLAPAVLDELELAAAAALAAGGLRFLLVAETDPGPLLRQSRRPGLKACIRSHLTLPAEAAPVIASLPGKAIEPRIVSEPAVISVPAAPEALPIAARPLQATPDLVPAVPVPLDPAAARRVQTIQAVVQSAATASMPAEASALPAPAERLGLSGSPPAAAQPVASGPVPHRGPAAVAAAADEAAPVPLDPATPASNDPADLARMPSQPRSRSGNAVAAGSAPSSTLLGTEAETVQERRSTLPVGQGTPNPGGDADQQIPTSLQASTRFTPSRPPYGRPADRVPLLEPEYGTAPPEGRFLGRRLPIVLALALLAVLALVVVLVLVRHLASTVPTSSSQHDQPIVPPIEAAPPSAPLSPTASTPPATPIPPPASLPPSSAPAPQQSAPAPATSLLQQPAPLPTIVVPVLPATPLSVDPGPRQPAAQPSRTAIRPGSLLLMTAPGDTLPSLYARVYRGVTPPLFETVQALNPGTLRPGMRLVFPAPDGGWPGVSGPAR